MNEITLKKKKTALVLGGGGSRGAYEIGVWQALKEMGIRIDMVYGTSVGAINAAMVAQGDLDITAKLWRELETDKVLDMDSDSTPVDYVKEIVVNQGAGTGPLREMLERYVDERIIRESGIGMGITAFSVPNLEKHFLRLEDIPEGKLNDYIMASASAFPVLHAYPIDGVSYIDGGYADALPVGMAVEDGATDVIAVDLDGFGSISKDNLKKAENLVYIKSKENLGFQFLFYRENSLRLIKLGYLDCLKAYGIIGGDYLAFSKGCFDKNTMRMADNLGEIFGMDSLIIYTAPVYMERIAEIVNQDIRNVNKLNKLLKIKSLKEMISFAEKEDIQGGIREAKAQKLLCYAAAEDMKKNGDGSIFLTRAALRMIPKPVNAARFLLKYQLI